MMERRRFVGWMGAAAAAVGLGAVAERWGQLPAPETRTPAEPGEVLADEPWYPTGEGILRLWIFKGSVDLLAVPYHREVVSRPFTWGPKGTIPTMTFSVASDGVAYVDVGFKVWDGKWLWKPVPLPGRIIVARGGDVTIKGGSVTLS